MRPTMNLTDAELNHLADFLARRLTPALQALAPAAVGQSVDETLVSQWRAALMDARGRGRLPATFRAAARALPHDEALQEAIAAFTRETPAQDAAPSAVGILAVAGGLLLLLVLLSFATTGTLAAVEALRSEPTDSALVAMDRQDGVPRDAAVAQAGETPPAATATVPPSQEQIGSGTSVPIVAEPLSVSLTPVPVALAPKSPSTKKAVVATARAKARVALDAPCKEDGWFYAGRDAPDKLFVVPHPVRVREAPPSKENGWNARTPVRCYLARGDVVRQAKAPMALPGGHFWVYVDPAKVERPDDIASADTGR